MAISNKTRDRIVTGLKRLLPIIATQKTRDVSEADTVTIVKDILSDAFGYDKYTELTSEHAIRGTFCDLAVHVDEKLVQLIEVKAVGISLDDRHVKQGIDYAANQGVEWVVLTNGVTWRMYHVIFAKPIDKELLLEINLQTIDLKKECDLENLYLFTKEGLVKGAPAELKDRQDASSRFTIAALMLNNDAIISTVRRELRRVVDVAVDEDVIIKVLRDEVIKRETLEGPAAEQATRRVRKKENHPLKSAKARIENDDSNQFVIRKGRSWECTTRSRDSVKHAFTKPIQRSTLWAKPPKTSSTLGSLPPAKTPKPPAPSASASPSPATSSSKPPACPTPTSAIP